MPVVIKFSIYIYDNDKCPCRLQDNTHVSVAECGKTKGCIRSTSGCSTDCDFLGTWKDEGSFVTFELTRKGSGWVALVLSRDQRMVGF